MKGRVLAKGSSTYGAGDMPGPRRPRTGPEAARHVHRQHRSDRAAPPASGRSSTTPSTRPWPATATRIDVTLLADGGCRGGRQRPRHPGRHQPAVQACPASRSRSRSSTAAASSAARATRSPVASTASACRWSTRCRPASMVEVDRDGKRHRMEFAQRRCAQGEARRSSATRLAGRTGTTVTFWPDPTVFETVEFSRADDARAPADDGVPQQGPRDPFRGRAARAREPSRSPTSTPAASSTSSSTSTRPRKPLFSKVGYFDAGRRRSGGRGRVPVEHRLQRPTASTPSPTASTPSKAACTRRASAPRSPAWSTGTRGPRTCSRRRTRTSSAKTSARASPPSSRCACATRSSRGRPRRSSATRRCARWSRGSPTRSSADWLEENPTEANKIVEEGHRRVAGADGRQEGA